MRYAQEATPHTHCFTTHFTGEMSGEEGSRVLYNYKRVQYWSNGINRSLFDREKLLYRAILRVDFGSDNIELYSFWRSANGNEAFAGPTSIFVRRGIQRRHN